MIDATDVDRVAMGHALHDLGMRSFDRLFILENLQVAECHGEGTKARIRGVVLRLHPRRVEAAGRGTSLGPLE